MTRFNRQKSYKFQQINYTAEGFFGFTGCPAPKEPSRCGDVHPTEIVTAHANYNPSLLFYTTAKTSKLIEFSLSCFPYGKRKGS